MKDLIIRGETTFPDGRVFYTETGYIDPTKKAGPIDPAFEAYMLKELPKAAHEAQALGNKGGPLKSVLSQTIDGEKQDLAVTGVTYEDHVKFQKQALDKQGEILKKFGEPHAKTKNR